MGVSMSDETISINKIGDTPFLVIIDGSSLLSTQFYGNLPKEIMFAKTSEEKEQYFNKIMQTTTGIYTNAVYGFLRVILKIIKEQKPKYLAVTWDVSRDTFRRAIYPEYKGNRGETLAPLKEQFSLCQDVLKEMNIPQFMDERYEADDFSGTLCSKFENDVPICIMTKDNDYLQLVTERTNLWLIHSTSKKTEELYKKYNLDQKKLNAPDRTFWFTPELVKAEFGIAPESVPSLKGLQGDASDNIKGVPGVGETTAVALMKEYKTIDCLYNTIRDLNEEEKNKIVEYWKSIGIKRSPMNYLLKESETELVGEKAAHISEILATIKKDIDLSDLSLEDLKIEINREKAKRMFELLEFHSLDIDKLLGMDNGTTKENSSKSDLVDSNANESANKSRPYLQSQDIQQVQDNLHGLDSQQGKDNQQVGYNSSTLDNLQGNGSLSPMKDFPKKINFAELINKEFVSDVLAEDSFEGINDLAKADEVFRKIKDLSKIDSSTKSIKDSSNEDSFYASFKIIYDRDKLFAISFTYKENKKICTAVIAAVGFITEDYLIEKINELVISNIELYTIDLKPQLIYLHATEGHPVYDLAVGAYLCNPALEKYEYSNIAMQVLGKELPDKASFLQKRSYEELYINDENAFLQLCSYESAVAYAAKDAILKALKETGMSSLYKEIEMPLIYTLFDMQCRGIKVNREELKEYGRRLAEGIERLEANIYELVGESFNINSPKQLGVILFEKLKLPFGKKTKTGYSTSAEILEKLRDDNPVISMILEYRQLTKLKSTYADGLDNYILEDGRIHGVFNQTVTATGRISSTEPNLQNIPIRMELGRQIRKVFIPEEGYVFLDADYSQIELRVLAHMSGDETLINAYKQAQDIHRLTASQVFHTPFDEVTSAQRSNAKAVNFGIVYGISSFSLGQDLDISRNDAQDYINKYFETYPKVKTFLDSIVESGRESGVVTTLFGRIRPVPELNNSNFMKRSAEERIAMNSPIQGTAADIIKIAMIRVNQELKKRNMKSRLLLQIHDELLVETEKSEVPMVKELMLSEMQNAADLLVPLIADINEGDNWYDAK